MVDQQLKAEFRKGFYDDRPAAWIERIAEESGDSEPDVRGCLTALANGQRDFAYPRHDAQVFDLLNRLVAERRLKRGADIGCATGSFPAMQLASGIEHCTVFEVRPARVDHERVTVRVHDLTYDEAEAEFDLVTCLSTIEHVGLGRYGDPLDPWGDVKMAANLRRLVKPGGLLMLSLPVGRGTVVYNAHRIYSRRRVRELFGDLRVVAQASGSSRLGSLRFGLQLLGRRPEAFSQPVYVLEKPA